MKNMEKCKTCENLDTERTNENWTVCSCMPTSVMVAGTSENCEKYQLAHVTDGSDCWCEPEIIDGVVVHRRSDN